MYEKFTDRARKIMQYANNAAVSMGHEYVGTEHILIGLIKEGSGNGVEILQCLRFDLAKVLIEARRLAPPTSHPFPTGKLPQTPRSKKVIEFAIDEARNLNDNYVGTEHLLLGLIREREGIAGRVLAESGLTIEDVREQLLMIRGVDSESSVTPTETETKTKTETVPSAAVQGSMADHIEDMKNTLAFISAVGGFEKAKKLLAAAHQVIQTSWQITVAMNAVKEEK